MSILSLPEAAFTNEEQRSSFPIEVHASSAAVTVPKGIDTLDGFLRWVWSDEFPESCKATFVGNEAFIDMSPENYATHNSLKAEIYSVLGTLIRRTKIGRFVVDDMIFVNRDANISTEPDAAFVSFESIQTGRARFEANLHGTPMMELHGTPDLVVEIVSPSSVRKDTVRLPVAYYNAGIPEFWLIDVRDQTIRFDIHRRGDSAYEVVAAVDDWRESRVLGRRFRIERFKDQAGLWDYILHVDPT